MIKTRPQLDAARRHAYRLGRQIGDMLDNGHDGDGQSVEDLMNAWVAFISQLQDLRSGDTTTGAYVAVAYKMGLGRSSYGAKIFK